MRGTGCLDENIMKIRIFKIDNIFFVILLTYATVKQTLKDHITSHLQVKCHIRRTKTSKLADFLFQRLETFFVIYWNTYAWAKLKNLNKVKNLIYPPQSTLVLRLFAQRPNLKRIFLPLRLFAQRPKLACRHIMNILFSKLLNDILFAFSCLVSY